MSSSRICGHCNKLLGIKAYKDHKRKYYHAGKWISQVQHETSESDVSSSLDFDLPSSPCPSMEVDDIFSSDTSSEVLATDSDHRF